MKRREANLRKAVLGFEDGAGSWYGLDNAAVIMPAVVGPVDTYLFRLSATLLEAVRLPALEAALGAIAARFPYFAVELRKGFFWHYLVPCTARPRVGPDSVSPCQGYDMHRRGTLLFRVRARDRTIACEFSHIITDGTGALRFFKNLLAEYFRRLDPADRNLDPDRLAGDPDLVDPASPVDPEETEDAYNRHYPGDYPFPPHETPAWHLSGRSIPRGTYRVTTAVIPLEAVLATARDYGASLTEFLVAVQIEALQTLWLDEGGGRRRHRLAIEVPVNMRTFCATKTNRNFSLFVHAAIDLRLGPLELRDIVSKVHHQVRQEVDLRGMRRHIARNVRGGRAPFIRAIPLFLKAPLMKTLYSYFGMNLISTVLSNLGPVRMPEVLAGRIERFGLMVGPSTATKVGASVLSWQDKLYLSIGSLLRSREFERLVLGRLQALGLPLRVECNVEE